MIDKLGKLLKSRIFIITTLFVASIFITFLSINRAPPPLPQPKQIDSNQISWNSVLPGKTKYTDLTELSDKPLVSLPKPDGSTVVSYQSTSQYWTNDVVIKNDTVDFVKQRLFPPDNTSFVDITKDLKSEPAALYGEEAQSNILLYVYSSEGLALLANKDKDVVFETWYFSPSTIASLLRRSEFQGYSTTEQLRDH